MSHGNIWGKKRRGRQGPSSPHPRGTTVFWVVLNRSIYFFHISYVHKKAKRHICLQHGSIGFRLPRTHHIQNGRLRQRGRHAPCYPTLTKPNPTVIFGDFWLRTTTNRLSLRVARHRVDSNYFLLLLLRYHLSIRSATIAGKYVVTRNQ